MTRRLPGLSSVLVWSLAGVIAVASPAHAAEGPLKVCADPNNMPFSNKEEKGFENRIASLMAETMGRELEYTWFPQRMGFIRNTLKSELRDGVYKCDLVIGVPSAYELAAATRPYYRSTYALIYGKGRGLDGIEKPSDMLARIEQDQVQPRIGVFDRGPGQLWFFYNGLIGNATPYVSQAGDPKETPLRVVKDIVANEMDVAIIWGPFAGYMAMENADTLDLIPMSDEEDPQRPQMRFNYSISMAVRYGEKDWKEEVNSFIENNQDAIDGILRQYRVPLLPLEG